MTDRDLQRHVEDSSDGNRALTPPASVVSVENGVVTLRGDVKTFTAKAAAERATLKV